MRTTAAPKATLLVFDVDGMRLALPLSQVQRVLRSVEITPLPAAPDVVCGVINVRGSVIAVVDLRQRFGLQQRPLSIHDQLVVAKTSSRIVALIADGVAGVRATTDADHVQGGEIAPGLDYVAGVVRCADGLVVIHDLDTFLSAAEERVLDGALAEYG